MNAGRELDALVAEKVMGWTRTTEPPYYSTDIAAAWEVVEKLSPEHFLEMFGRSSWWYARFRLIEGESEPMPREEYADTPTLAICLAALKRRAALT